MKTTSAVENVAEQILSARFFGTFNRMKKALLIIFLMVLSVSTQAATIQADLRDLGGVALNTPVQFVPQSNPQVLGGTVNYGVAKTVVPINGLINTNIVAGIYTIKVQPYSTANVLIPTNDAIYNLTTLLTNLVPTDGSYTNDPNFKIKLTTADAVPGYLANKIRFVGSGFQLGTNPATGNQTLWVTNISTGGGSSNAVAAGSNVTVATNIVGGVTVYTVSASLGGGTVTFTDVTNVVNAMILVSNLVNQAQLDMKAVQQTQFYFVGDSRTADDGTPGIDNWSQQMMTNILMRSYGYNNLAIGGGQVSQAVAAWSTNVVGYNNFGYYQNTTNGQRWVFTWLGGNDNTGTNETTVKSNLTFFLTLIKAVTNTTIVQLPITYQTNWNSAQLIEATNLNVFLATNSLIDYFVTNLTSYASDDGIHPTIAGSATIANAVLARITNSLPVRVPLSGNAWVGQSTFRAGRPLTKGPSGIGALIAYDNIVLSEQAGLWYRDPGTTRMSSGISFNKTDPAYDSIEFSTYGLTNLTLKQGGELQFGASGPILFMNVAYNGNPEGIYSGALGSIFVDQLTGNIYTRQIGAGTLNTGWVLFNNSLNGVARTGGTGRENLFTNVTLTANITNRNSGTIAAYFGVTAAATDEKWWADYKTATAWHYGLVADAGSINDFLTATRSATTLVDVLWQSTSNRYVGTFWRSQATSNEFTGKLFATGGAKFTGNTASRVAIFNASSDLTNSAAVDTTELEYLDGVTSAIQGQLDGKAKTTTNNSASAFTAPSFVVPGLFKSPTNTPSDGQYVVAVGTAGDTKYLTVSAGSQTNDTTKASVNGGTNATHTTPTIVGGSITSTNLIAGAMGPIEQPAINGNIAFPTNLVWKFTVNDTNNFLVGVPLGLIKDWGYTFKFSTTNGGARLSPSWTNVNQIVGTTNLAANTITSFKVIFDGTNTIAYNLNDTNTPAYLADVVASTNGLYRPGGTDVAVSDGGTGISSGTSGGVLYFSGSTTIASSAALAANALVIGGGAGAVPSTTTTGSGILAFLGTPSSANLLAAVTDETGSGALVFGTAPQLSTIELGNASDTTLSRSAAGLLAVEGNILVSRSELAGSNYLTSATPSGAATKTFYNFTLNTPFTNTSGQTLDFFVPVDLHAAAVNGASALDIMANDSGASGVTNYARSAMSTLITSISMDYTNLLAFSLQQGGFAYATNTSTGAGNSSAIISGGYYVPRAGGTNFTSTNLVAQSVGTATQTNTITTTANEVSANIGTLYLTNGLYRTIDVPAGAMISNITLGATFTSLERFSPTNRQDDFFIFADGTTNLVSFSIAMPEEWDRSTVKVKFMWTTTNSIATQTNVWGISATAISHDDVMTADWGTEQVVNSPVTTADDLLVSPATSALTVAGSPQIGDLVYFRVRRLGGSANDAMSNAQARLLHVVVQYREAAGTGAAAW